VLAEDPLALDEAVAVLRHFGLVRADEQMLTLDRLLEQVVRDGLDPAGKAVQLGGWWCGCWPGAAVRRLCRSGILAGVRRVHIHLAPLRGSVGERP
jgi:hypothetical protein